MTYDELNKMEDSIIPRKLSNEIEKRIFKINVDQMPKGKTRDFIVKIRRNYINNG